MVWAGSGGLRDLAGGDAFTHFGGWTERNSLVKQKEEVSKRQEGRKHHGTPTVSWCDAFPVELEVGWHLSKCHQLCAGGGGAFLQPRQPLGCAEGVMQSLSGSVGCKGTQFVSPRLRVWVSLQGWGQSRRLHIPVEPGCCVAG